MTIRDFTQSILDGSGDDTLARDWEGLLTQQGYCSVPIQTNREFLQVNAWCNQHIGEDHYVWTGSSYWFETDEAAVLFSLRWL
jgi:hypothetical protein